MTQNYAAAFRSQSHADFEAFKELSARSDGQACHKALLLQMAREKVAKADLSYFASLGTVPHKGAMSHKQVHDWFRNVYSARGHKLPNGVADQDVKDVLLQIEAANPSVAGKGQPNAEYPWETTPGEWRAPHQHMWGLLEGPPTAAFVFVLEMLSDHIGTPEAPTSTTD